MPAHDFQPVAPEKGDSKSHELTMIQQFLILSQFHLVGLPCRHKRAFCSPVDIFWIVQIVSKQIIFRLFKVIFWLSTRVNHNQTTTIWGIFYFFSNHIKQIQVIMSRFRYPGSFFFAAFFEFISLNPSILFDQSVFTRWNHIPRFWGKPWWIYEMMCKPISCGSWLAHIGYIAPKRHENSALGIIELHVRIGLLKPRSNLRVQNPSNATFLPLKGLDKAGNFLEGWHWGGLGPLRFSRLPSCSLWLW